MTAPAPTLLRHAHVRIARPTDRLEEIVSFYENALGFVTLGRFEGHDGFDGVMLGHRGSGYHLEFTRADGHPAPDAPTQDHLLVFYVPDPGAWAEVVEHVEATGVAPVASLNPYWDRHGRTYEDPDGYRIVIVNASWPPDAG